ncbi:MAG: prolipoprotein diacylglyceryl transferase [Clostridia bacterium]|nr:prolipoprotein diacylglyceryl transferase [Clostridia bacterium]
MYPKIILGSLELSSTNVFHLIGATGLLIYCLFTRKKYNITKAMAVFYSVFLVCAGLVEFRIMGKIQSALLEITSSGELVLETSRRILGVMLFQPIVIFVLSFFTGDKFRKIADFIAPGTFICFVFGKIACLLEGCCYGYPDTNGVYSAICKTNVFPVQLYESLSAVVVVAILTVLLSDKIRLRKGSLFPIGSILYSVVRIFWENYRYYDNQWEKEFFLGMNFWQTVCVVVIIISVIWLIVLYTKSEYAECSFESCKDTLITKGIAVYKKYKLDKRKKSTNYKPIVHSKKKRK